MTVVNLDNIGMNLQDRRKAVMWLYEKYGPAGDEWSVDKLTYVRFKTPKYATYFIMRFS